MQLNWQFSARLKVTVWHQEISAQFGFDHYWTETDSLQHFSCNGLATRIVDSIEFESWPSCKLKIVVPIISISPIYWKIPISLASPWSHLLLYILAVYILAERIFSSGLAKSTLYTRDRDCHGSGLIIPTNYGKCQVQTLGEIVDRFFYVQLSGLATLIRKTEVGGMQF